MKNNNKQTLDSLILKRLYLINEIAKYKCINKLPIIDKRRENFQIEKILEKSNNLNLNENQIHSFFKKQIKLATIFQLTKFEKWKIDNYSEIFSNQIKIDLKNLRLEIDQINLEMIKTFHLIKNS